MNQKSTTNTIILIVGAALVLFGAWFLFGHLFGSVFAVVWRILTLVVGSIFALLIIVVGIALIIHVHKQNSQKDQPQNATVNTSKKRLYRSTTNRTIAGICGGLAEYLQINPLIIRIIVVVCAFVCFYLVIPLYLICWAIIPSNTQITNTWT